MRNTLLILLAFLTFGAFAQDGHITYTDVSNSKNFGRDVLVRTKAANLDTLTSVYDGSIAFDTIQRFATVYDGSSFQELSYGKVRDTSITIASAAVLTLNATPVTIVAAITGKTLSVLDFSMKQTYVSAAYAGNTTLAVKCTGADVGQMQMSNVLAHTVSGHWGNWAKQSASTPQTQLVSGAGLQIYVPTGDPTTGDSNITVYLRYRIIEP